MDRSTNRSVLYFLIGLQQTDLYNDVVREIIGRCIHIMDEERMLILERNWAKGIGCGYLLDRLLLAILLEVVTNIVFSSSL